MLHTAQPVLIADRMLTFFVIIFFLTVAIYYAILYVDDYRWSIPDQSESRGANRALSLFKTQ
jgi:preprotein translocase subunit SecY